MAMKPTTHRGYAQRTKPHSGVRSHTAQAKPGVGDPVDDTTVRNAQGLRRDKDRTDGTTALWCFLGGLAVSLATVAAGEMGGWLLLALTLSMGYVWMPKKPVKPTPPVYPKPTQVSPRMQRLLTEPKGMLVLGSILLASMILVGWLSNG
jgi:hypothetical protein